MCVYLYVCSWDLQVCLWDLHAFPSPYVGSNSCLYYIMFGVVCKQFCFELCRNCSRDVDQIIFSTNQSGSEQKDCVYCIVFRTGASLKVYEYSCAYASECGSLKFRGRWVWCLFYISELFVHKTELISSMLRWLHEFQKEFHLLNLWIKGTQEEFLL